MVDLPSGTVTFLFTDLEVSTRLWEEYPDAMKAVLARHDEILRHSITTHEGHVVKMRGDGAHAVFATAEGAVAAAVDAQLALQREPWDETGPLRVRIGLHTGTAQLRDGDYFGSSVNRAARLMSIAHGGQVVCSQSTADLSRDSLAGGITMRDLGEHRLAGLSRTENVFQVDAPGLATEFPPLQSLDALPGNLPRQMTSFVGRDKEVAEIAALVRSRPLVTLTGVGGVGKTRLAYEVAAVVVDEFPDGAWVCELAALSDPDALWEAVASTFRVSPSPGRRLDDVVLDALTSKRLVLVLDNCEHLLDPVATLVQAVGARCARVAVLATSREGLAVPGEQIVAVPSLGVPAEDARGDAFVHAESVVLFCERAHSVRSDFALTASNASAVAVLCRRLDGIPLAIELAAARVRSLAVEDIVNRLDQRFKLLTRGSRGALERHQTLRSTIDWSYDLLDDRERTALNRLSVFAGGCDLQAAEAVLGGEDLDVLDVVDLLAQLVDKSLVLADPDADGHLRYRLLETIRQYAEERLESSGDAPIVRRRHADYFVSLAEAARPKLRSREQVSTAHAVARDTDNFRVTLDWAVESGEAGFALQLVSALAVRGVSIGYAAMAWAEKAVAVADAAHYLWFPEVASWATWSATARRDLPLARRYAAMIEPAEDELGTHSAAACRGPATLAFFTGDYGATRSLSEEQAERARRDDDAYELSQALILLAASQNAASGDEELAFRTCEEAVQVARDAGIVSSLAMGLNFLARLLPEHSDRAVDVLDEALRIGIETDDPVAMTSALTGKAWIEAARGDYVAALHMAQEATERQFEAGLHFSIGPAILTAAVALAHLGPVEPAAVLFGAGQHLTPESGSEWGARLVAQTRALLVEQLGKTRYDSLIARGAQLGIDEAVTALLASPTP
jgi:predicted ATPase/class 3 adenylate cyclase